MTTALSKLGIARRALIAAKSLNDVLAVGDMAAAIKAYAKASGESLEIQNSASDLRLSAERKAGELLAEMELNEGSKNRPGGNTMLLPKLADIGITKMQSSRWQLAAKLPEAEYGAIVEHCNASEKELTQAVVLKAARIFVYGETEPAKPLPTGGNANLLEMISAARESIALLVDLFGEMHKATLIGVLRDELQTLEGDANGGS